MHSQLYDDLPIVNAYRPLPAVQGLTAFGRARGEDFGDIALQLLV